MKPVKEIVHEYFPDANDELIDFIIWEKTGYPSFWNGDPETVFRQQLKEYQLTTTKNTGG